MRNSGQGEPPAAEQLLTVATAVRSGVLLVTVAGEVDLLTAPRLRRELADAVCRAHGGPVVVDLSQVILLGSSGLGALVDSAAQAMQLHVPLRLVVDHQRAVERPLQLTGLDQVLTVYHNLNAALSVRE